MDTIDRARELLQNGQEDEAVQLLAPAAKKDPENPVLLELFGQALLEANDVESAYDVLTQAVKVDSEALYGVDKFLYLGQIIGGTDGVALLDIALGRLLAQLDILNRENSEGSTDSSDLLLVELAKEYSPEQLQSHLVRKVNQAIFAEIEIWMTDLCMEEAAESTCDRLIGQSLALDPENPEAHALLALIRISQQNNEEARSAINRAWELFQNRIGGEKEEYNDQLAQELVQPLLALARYAVEVELYDVAPLVCAGVANINDMALDAFYVAALAHVFKAKKILHEASGDEGDYRDIENKQLLASANTDVSAAMADAKSALTQGYRVIQSGGESDPDVIAQVSQMLEEFGGPVMEELVEKRGGDDDDDVWEEIGEE